MRLIWKLLRQHISTAQLAGFFLANLVGIIIVLLTIQFYKDVYPVFSGKDGLMKNEYIIISKKISALSGLIKKSNTFTEQEIKDLEKQPFVEEVGPFTPSLFKVTAGIGGGKSGMQLYTDMFFESVPDEFIDVDIDKWKTSPDEEGVIPIIIPRNYLNLYNFGFAQSQNLPQLSEGLVGMVKLNIHIRGNAGNKDYKGNIVGFSNRLNTILVPESFLNQANATFAPYEEANPSRLIVEVKNPADPALVSYIEKNGYETENESLDSSKTTHILRIITGIIIGIGLLICLLAFYILMLSIFLLLQKNTTKLTNLILIGYSPAQVARPYQIITIGLNILVLLLAIIAVLCIRPLYARLLSDLFPMFTLSSAYIIYITGTIITIAITVVNLIIIRRKIYALAKAHK